MPDPALLESILTAPEPVLRERVVELADIAHALDAVRYLADPHAGMTPTAEEFRCLLALFADAIASAVTPAR